MNRLLRIALTVVSVVGFAGIAIAQAMPKGNPVHIVPEPISTSLFILGGAAMGIKTYLKNRSKK